METSVKEEASKVSTLVEKATDQQERCCQLNREAMENLQESVKDLPRGLPGGQDLVSGASWFLVGRALGLVVTVVIVSLVGGVAFVVTDYLYLKARQRLHSSVVVFYLLCENLKVFFFMGMALASLNLVWNMFKGKPLNDKWINLSGGLLGGGPLFAGEFDPPFIVKCGILYTRSGNQCI